MYYSIHWVLVSCSVTYQYESHLIVLIQIVFGRSKRLDEVRFCVTNDRSVNKVLRINMFQLDVNRVLRRNVFKIGMLTKCYEWNRWMLTMCCEGTCCNVSDELWKHYTCKFIFFWWFLSVDCPREQLQIATWIKTIWACVWDYACMRLRVYETTCA